MQHAEDLFKRGVNVLEDSSNWDWDESQQMTVSTSPSSLLALIGSLSVHKPATNTNTFAKPSFQITSRKVLCILLMLFFPAVLRFEEIKLIHR